MSGAGLGGSQELALFTSVEGCGSRSALTLLAAALVLVIGLAFCALLSSASCTDAGRATPAAVEQAEAIESPTLTGS